MPQISARRAKRLASLETSSSSLTDQLRHRRGPEGSDHQPLPDAPAASAHRRRDPEGAALLLRAPRLGPPRLLDVPATGQATAPGRARRRRHPGVPLLAARDGADARLPPGHAADGLLPRPDRASDLALGDGAPSARVVPRPADGDREVRPRPASGDCRRGEPEPDPATLCLLARSVRRPAGACPGTLPDRAVDALRVPRVPERPRARPRPGHRPVGGAALRDLPEPRPPDGGRGRGPERTSERGRGPGPRRVVRRRPAALRAALRPRHLQLADQAGPRRHARDRGLARKLCAKLETAS